IRRCSGMWPPSKPRLNLYPERDCAPLWPRPACVPVPDPWPRPTRFLFLFEPSEGFRSLKSMTLVLYGHEVPHLVNHPTRLGRVDELHRVPETPQAQARHGLGLRAVEADRASNERDFEALGARLLCRFLGHVTLRPGPPIP